MNIKSYTLIFFGIFFGVLLINQTLAYTAPAYSSVNFTLCTVYTPENYSSLNFTLTDSDPCANTCTAPSSGNNWAVLWSDNCTVSANTDIGKGNLSLYGGAGQFTIMANLTCYNVYKTANESGTKFVLVFPGSLRQVR